MLLSYRSVDVFISGLNSQLGSVHRDLSALKAGDLLSNPIDALAKMGYENNYSVAPGETLLSLAAAPLSACLKLCPDPEALVFHHSYSDNTTVLPPGEDRDIMSRVRYFPAALMNQFRLDNVPYYGSFASGCTGFISLLVTAGGLLAAGAGPTICLTSDIKPAGATYDALHEKILTSDCSSAFVCSTKRPHSSESPAYQLLGISYYSTTRTFVALVEVVKRTVQMIRDLAQKLEVPLDRTIVVHYPNIFPQAWSMVSQYLKIPLENHILEGMAERAHCLSSDSVMTLACPRNPQPGRLHIVVNFGSGLHLGVCILKEVAL